MTTTTAKTLAAAGLVLCLLACPACGDSGATQVSLGPGNTATGNLGDACGAGSVCNEGLVCDAETCAEPAFALAGTVCGDVPIDVKVGPSAKVWISAYDSQGGTTVVEAIEVRDGPPVDGDAPVDAYNGWGQYADKSLYFKYGADGDWPLEPGSYTSAWEGGFQLAARDAGELWGISDFGDTSTVLVVRSVDLEAQTIEADLFLSTGGYSPSFPSEQDATEIDWDCPAGYVEGYFKGTFQLY